jgi:hypothetical protein
MAERGRPSVTLACTSMSRIMVNSGPLAGRRVAVDREMVIGREQADLTIDDPELSRRHAVLRPLADGLEVEDLRSTNGTFVDGRRIDGPTRVGLGAHIQLGSTELEVEGVTVTQETRLGPQAPDLQRTRIGSALPAVGPRTLAAAADSSTPPPERSAASAGSAVPPALPSSPPARTAPAPGAFSPPVRRRRRGLASRSWIPVVLSFGTVMLTAAGLVAYFAAR